MKPLEGDYLPPNPHLARTLAAIRERCRLNAEIARTDLDRRRVAETLPPRTPAQFAEQRRELR